MRNALTATLVAVLMTITAISAQQKPTPNAHNDADKLIQGGGQMPAGWKVRFDKPDAKPETVKVRGRAGRAGLPDRAGGDLLQARHEGGKRLRGQRLVFAAGAPSFPRSSA